MELLFCGVTKGKSLLPVRFPPCWHFLEGRVCWVRPSLVWEYSKGGNNEVSLKSPATGEEQARPAAFITGAPGRRCMSLVHFQVPLEGERSWGWGEG